MTPEEVSDGLNKELGALVCLYPKAMNWEALAKTYIKYTEPALVAWKKDIEERKWAEENYTKALEETAAYRAQFRGVGITPYLERMDQLAARIDVLWVALRTLRQCSAIQQTGHCAQCEAQADAALEAKA